MKANIFFTMALALTGFSSQAFAASSDLNCPSQAEVLKRTHDDHCEKLVDASIECFASANLLYTKWTKEQTSVSQIRLTYTEAQSALEDYLQHIKKIECGDQEVQLDTIILELKKDLADINKKK